MPCRRTLVSALTLTFICSAWAHAQQPATFQDFTRARLGPPQPIAQPRIERAQARIGGVILGTYVPGNDVPGKDAQGKDIQGKDTHGKDANGKEGHKEGHEVHHEHEPRDLLLCGFFCSGWGEKFEERHRQDAAPRFNLFKSRQGFLERIAFLDYAYTHGSDGGRGSEQELVGGIEWAINRRIGVGVETLYAWRHRAAEGTEASKNSDGQLWDFSTRLQLIDTSERAYNFQVHVVTPSSQLDSDQTQLAFTLAGFEDLTKTLCLYRVGLYHHIEYVSFLGPRGPVDDLRPSGLFRYDVSLAKTLVGPRVPLIGDFTIFAEAFGQTAADGSHSGRTDFSLTPGIRFNPTGCEERAWWIQLGMEIPVAGSRPFSERFLLAIIHDF